MLKRGYVLIFVLILLLGAGYYYLMNKTNIYGISSMSYTWVDNSSGEPTQKVAILSNAAKDIYVTLAKDEKVISWKEISLMPNQINIVHFNNAPNYGSVCVCEKNKDPNACFEKYYGKGHREGCDDYPALMRGFEPEEHNYMLKNDKPIKLKLFLPMARCNESTWEIVVEADSQPKNILNTSDLKIINVPTFVSVMTATGRYNETGHSNTYASKGSYILTEL